MLITCFCCVDYAVYDLIADNSQVIITIAVQFFEQHLIVLDTLDKIILDGEQQFHGNFIELLDKKILDILRPTPDPVADQSK